MESPLDPGCQRRQSNPHTGGERSTQGATSTRAVCLGTLRLRSDGGQDRRQETLWPPVQPPGSRGQLLLLSSTGADLSAIHTDEYRVGRRHGVLNAVTQGKGPAGLWGPAW